MTEQNLGQNISGDSGVGDSSSQTAEVSLQEEMIPKSKVTQLVRERYNHAYDKGFQEALAKAQVQAQNTQVPMQAQPASSNDPILQELKKEIYGLKDQLQKGEDERVAKEQAARATEIGNQLKPKLDDARKKYSDFDNVVNQQAIQAVPGLLGFANEVENGGEVMYELLNNPERLGQLCALPNADFVRKAVRNLSQALKTNQASANAKIPREPISQVQASNLKTVDSGKPSTIAELRRKYRT